MRFRAPPRSEIDASVFEHPLFAEYRAWQGWLSGDQWPPIEVVSDAVNAACAGQGLPQRRLVVQDAALDAEALHYELRIAHLGCIPTRADNWHDLLNALVWIRHPRIKHAMNQRQVADIAVVGDKQRSRGQCALTHFDEAGIVLLLRDQGRIEAWNRHDWPAVFLGLSTDDFAVSIIGHALLEHGLDGERLLVGKALAVHAQQPAADLAPAMEQIAKGIADGSLLRDPAELRPLPLMGLPGWHREATSAEFFAEAPCFQPIRAGRTYPPAIRLQGCESSRMAADPA